MPPATTYKCEHNHDGRFRGWLCHPCNAGIGHFEDSPGLLARAIRYLEAPR